jgi:hypothetical protein
MQFVYVAANYATKVHWQMNIATINVSFIENIFVIISSVKIVSKKSTIMDCAYFLFANEQKKRKPVSFLLIKFVPALAGKDYLATVVSATGAAAVVSAAA